MCDCKYVLCSFSGANPNRRDRGRGLCAEQWARFCGCHNSAEAISKYIHSKKYFFKKAFLMSKDKWSSEPDLASSHKTTEEGDTKSRGGGSWIQRHLSLKRKKNAGDKKTSSTKGDFASVASTNRSGSAPLLITISPATSPVSSTSRNFRRPSCIDGVVPVSIIPKLRVTSDQLSSVGGVTLYEDRVCQPIQPPTITVAGDSDTETDSSKPLG